VKSIAEVRVGEELPERARVVTAADVRAYADAGGDQNPLHQDEAVARGAGFPGIVAHGMFTMGHMAATVVAWAGDVQSVSWVTAQFRAAVFIGDEIVAGGRVIAVDADAGTATLDLWVRVERGGAIEWPIKKGRATVRLTQ
jgi:acyl dehydratase